jgi:cytochrome c-type biogenesis protein CcmH/NrfG
MDELDTNSQILQELRKLNWYSRSSFVFVIVLLFVFIAISTITIWKGPFRSPSPQKTIVSWDDVRCIRNSQQFAEALSSAKGIMQKTPNDWYGHSFLGYIHLEMGSLNNAQNEFAIAFKLWPTEDNEKNLKAIRKRIELEKTGR